MEARRELTRRAGNQRSRKRLDRSPWDEIAVRMIAGQDARRDAGSQSGPARRLASNSSTLMTSLVGKVGNDKLDAKNAEQGEFQAIMTDEALLYWMKKILRHL